MHIPRLVRVTRDAVYVDDDKLTDILPVEVDSVRADMDNPAAYRVTLTFFADAVCFEEGGR